MENVFRILAEKLRL